MKVFNLNIETLKQISSDHILKNSPIQPKKPKITLKLIGTKNASWRNTQKMKFDSLYEESPKECSDPTQTTNSPYTALNDPKISNN